MGPQGCVCRPYLKLLYAALYYIFSSRKLDTGRAVPYAGAMTSLHDLYHRMAQRRELRERLDHAMVRLAEAERERAAAIRAAQAGGLSIRDIADATGLSRSRVHQLLHEPGAR